jgi:hypothetical protein
MAARTAKVAGRAKLQLRAIRHRPRVSPNGERVNRAILWGMRILLEAVLRIVRRVTAMRG